MLKAFSAAAIIAMSFAGSMTPASACDRGRETCSFKLFNNTSVELRSFWSSPARVSRWEEDVLGRRTLSAGDEINVNMSDNRPDCIYDMKFQFADGDVVTRRGVNVCRLGRYTLND